MLGAPALCNCSRGVFGCTCVAGLQGGVGDGGLNTELKGGVGGGGLYTGLKGGGGGGGSLAVP